jgi:prophage regulatory protein
MKSNVRRHIALPHQDNPALTQEVHQQRRPLTAHPSIQQSTEGQPLRGDASDQAAANEPSTNMHHPYTLLTIAEVIKIAGIGRTMIYELIKSNAFPAPVKVGGASRWVLCEISLWIQGLMQQRAGASTKLAVDSDSYRRVTVLVCMLGTSRYGSKFAHSRLIRSRSPSEQTTQLEHF